MDDLENWSGPHEVFHNDGSFRADMHYQAPEVHKWNGAFYMFASFKTEGICRCTCILKADHPLGPFVHHNTSPITPGHWECLDARLAELLRTENVRFMAELFRARKQHLHNYF